MTNLLKQGAKWLSDRLAESASENIVYARQGQTYAINVAATRGFPDRDLEEAVGYNQVDNVFDWFVQVADIAALGEPANGDVIIWGTAFFEVNALGGGQDSWRPADEFNLRYRIHTKQISQSSWLTIPATYTGIAA